MKKIPSDAFAFYVALGASRSYRVVGERYNVSKQGVAKYAARENWTERLEIIEAEAQRRSEAKLVESLEEMRTRHLKMVKAMSARALAGIKAYPISSGMDAMRAAEMSIKLERLIAGEASQRSEVSIEEVTQRELDTLVRVEGDDEEQDDDSEEEATDGSEAA